MVAIKKLKQNVSISKSVLLEIKAVKILKYFC